MRNAGTVSDALLTHRDLAGVHFTGSTEVFNGMWETIGRNIGNYRSYPRIVGETGGKDFIVAHPSADPAALAVAVVRGGFEYQGQKCSAASRMYVPKSRWNDIRDRMVAMMKEIKVGDVLKIRTEANTFEVEVLVLSEMRGPSAVALTLYRETESSRQLREAIAQERKLLRQMEPPREGRPTKRDRRKIIQFRSGTD